MTVEQRLHQFVGNWNSITVSQRGLVGRLSLLITDLRTLIRSVEFVTEQQADLASPSQETGRLAAIIAQLSPALARARQHGGEINVWQMAGLKRAEVRNAAVLAALWSSARMGDRAMIFLDGFLRRLRPADGLPLLEELRLGYVVRTEHCATGAATERVDITIEGQSFVVAIEVKIGAGEGPEQLARYRKSVEEWARTRGKRGAVVLLAPFQTSVPGIVQADWRDVVKAASATLPSKRTAYTHTDRLIDDFARHAAAFQGARH